MAGTCRPKKKLIIIIIRMALCGIPNTYQWRVMNENNSWHQRYPRRIKILAFRCDGFGFIDSNVVLNEREKWIGLFDKNDIDLDSKCLRASNQFINSNWRENSNDCRLSFIYSCSYHFPSNQFHAIPACLRSLQAVGLKSDKSVLPHCWLTCGPTCDGRWACYRLVYEVN